MDQSVYIRMAEFQARHWWFCARREILRAEIVRMRLPTNAQILDAGCGTGANLEMLASFGSVTGMELNEAACAHAKSLGFEVTPGALPGAPFSMESFDLIGAFDVIEHIEDDYSAVADLAGLLRPGGRILATVPANPWMWSAHDKHHHHFRRYDIASFRALFEAAGLEIVRATYFNTLLFPIASATRLVRNAVFGRDREAHDDRMPNALANAALRSVFQSETALLGLTDLPFGVSCMIVARRA